MTGKVHNSADIVATPTTSLATVLASLTWGGTAYPSYEGRNEVPAAGAPAATPTTTPTATPTSAAAAGGPGTPPAASASPAGGQTPAGSPTAQPGQGAAPSDNDANIRVLRQNYESLKPWEKVAQTVKDPTAALTAVQRVTAMQNEGSRLAAALGYTAQSFAEAFADDPVDTLQHLRAEFSKQHPGQANAQALERLAAEAARKATEPLTKELNERKTVEAQQRLETELTRLTTDEQLGFGANCPDVIKDAMTDLVDILVPDQALIDLKLHGKTAGIQKAHAEAKAMLIKVVNAYNEMMSGGGARRQASPAATPAATAAASAARGASKLAPAQMARAGDKPITLDDIIGNPDVLPGVHSGAY